MSNRYDRVALMVEAGATMTREGIGWTLGWLLFGTLVEEWLILHASYFGSSSYAEVIGVIAWIATSALVFGLSQLYFWRGFDMAYLNSVDYACLAAGVVSVLTVIGALNEFHVRNHDQLTEEARRTIGILQKHVEHYRGENCDPSDTRSTNGRQALCQFMDNVSEFSVAFGNDPRLTKLTTFTVRPDISRLLSPTFPETPVVFVKREIGELKTLVTELDHEAGWKLRENADPSLKLFGGLLLENIVFAKLGLVLAKIRLARDIAASRVDIAS
jgi:hypothetical protein